MQILPSHASGSQVNPTGLQIIQQGDNLLIDARLLHKKLKSKQEFASWIKARIKDYRFDEQKDYLINLSNRIDGKAGKKRIDYLLSIDTAKELAMLERNEIGRAIRQYFIQAEKQARALPHFSNDQIAFKGIQRKRINDRVMLLFREVRERCGYSTRSSTSSERARYWMHFVKEGMTLYCTEEYATHKLHQKKVFNNRTALKAAQPVLPFNFGDTDQLKGGVK